MTQTISALVGLSGVGKSTLLRNLGAQLPFQHLQASQLIKSQILEERALSIESDALRNSDIDDNQRLLIDGFYREVDSSVKFVVLDGHTVIDTPSGLVEVDPIVFSRLGITRLVFLADDPTEIYRRRASDVSRSRPHRTETELAEHQELALLVAFKAALLLRVPFIVAAPYQSKVIVDFLSA